MQHLTIHAGHGSANISKYLYGHFAEHLGRCIYDGCWVGPDSPIPNIRGMRTDVVTALRKLNPPVLRWPGGCFADDYHWTQGIGPREGRRHTINAYWGGVVETNAFGTHEFFDLCELIGADPYICGNVGSGTVREMKQWVEYCTFDGDSSLSALRRQHGHPDPWRLPFFGVGNENWGCGGNMRPEYYADEYRRFAAYVRDFGNNTIYKIACGANGADYPWTEVLMREVAPFMHGLSLHYYTVPGDSWAQKGSATQFAEAEWFTTLRKALVMEELVTQHSAIMDRYDPEGRVGLIVDEWGTWYDVEPDTDPGFLYQQNSLRDAMVAALTLHIFHRHCARVRMANIAQLVNVLQAMLLTEGDKLVCTPTYHVFEMFKVHQEATLLPLELAAEEYRLGDESIPMVSASASQDNEGTIHLSLCNTHPYQPAELTVELTGREIAALTGRILTAPEITSHNTFTQPDAVYPVPFDHLHTDGHRFTTTLPPKSIVVLSLVV